jgi:hypothetical protein
MALPFGLRQGVGMSPRNAPLPNTEELSTVAGVGFKAFSQNTPELKVLEEGLRPAGYFRTDEQAPKD